MLEPAPPADDTSDAPLLARVAAGPSRDARLAQAAFYARHVGYLHGVLRRREGTLRRAAGLSVEDLVQDTFQRAFQYAASYRAGDTGDPERERRRARAWLGRIAQNLIADALTGNQEVSSSPFIERVSDEDVDEPAPPSSPELRSLREALSDLSEREQDVLRVTALHHRVGGGEQRLPNDVSAALAARWDTNSQNIRAIRSRALKKLERWLAPLTHRKDVTP